MKKIILIFVISLYCLPLLVKASTTVAINVQKVVDTQTAIPDGNGYFTHLDSPYIHQGNIVFRGFGANYQAGVYTNLYGGLKKIADRNTAIPRGIGKFIQFGIPMPFSQKEYQQFKYLGYNSPALDQARVTFTAQGTLRQEGIYLYANDALQVVADKKTFIPHGQGKFQHLYYPYLNNGKVAFYATGKKNQQGIYISNKHCVEVLYDTNSKIPNKQETFTSFWNPSFDGGYSAFRATDRHNKVGVYSDSGGTLQTIADQSTPIPDGEGQFISLGAPSLQNNELAFRGIGKHEQAGIYYYAKGQLKSIVTNKTMIPEGGGHFTGVFNPTLDHGNIVFIGTGENNQQGIYIYYQGALQKIITINDSLEGKKINKLDLGAVALSGNQITFHSIFEDKTEGIYVATINAIHADKEFSVKDINGVSTHSYSNFNEVQIKHVNLALNIYPNKKLFQGEAEYELSKKTIIAMS